MRTIKSVKKLKNAEKSLERFIGICYYFDEMISFLSKSGNN